MSASPPLTFLVMHIDDEPYNAILFSQSLVVALRQLPPVKSVEMTKLQAAHSVQRRLIKVFLHSDKVDPQHPSIEVLYCVAPNTSALPDTEPELLDNHPAPRLRFLILDYHGPNGIYGAVPTLPNLAELGPLLKPYLQPAKRSILTNYYTSVPNKLAADLQAGIFNKSAPSELYSDIADQISKQSSVHRVYS